MTVLLLLCLQDPSTTKEAMQRLQFTIGKWKCTVADKDNRDKSWQEKQDWTFKIDKDDYSLVLTVTDGQWLKEAQLSYDPKKKLYRMTATRTDDKKLTFEGKFEGKTLGLDEVVAKDSDQERVELIPLHENRFLISRERRSGGKESFLQTHAWGCTREGVSFAANMPKCVVTGGSATIEVQHKGKTYYVC
jgi:hypothetical protein